jgi:hypothetical protein
LDDEINDIVRTQKTEYIEAFRFKLTGLLSELRNLKDQTRVEEMRIQRDHMIHDLRSELTSYKELSLKLEKIVEK